ncbi:plastocyanin/azurin family copper-binding protein [Paraconexibacter antarcticus]|uniref:Plastocyanin/azurin family copper-binding protein n=1 Tax=Paraconexibacter antarcticus TaxID=2949664 RepID=A0ABY5DR23_9ACTN|nr:plastocyanin/azurin family copper-binding protein [Paraconexibacter antarcticus]UTI63703.1 plastocyanin/azurin family copper-binding protein [Paraconexibacter antarcticus]
MPISFRPAPTGAVLAALVLGGGGAALVAGPATATTSSTVHLKANPSGKLRFTTTRLTAKAGRVTVKMLNPAGSGLPHGIAVEGHGVDRDGRIVTSGHTSTVTVTLKRGTYEFYCPVKGHKAAGMVGKLVVR